jgi:hypothetical protein
MSVNCHFYCQPLWLRANWVWPATDDYFARERALVCAVWLRDKFLTLPSLSLSTALRGARTRSARVKYGRAGRKASPLCAHNKRTHARRIVCKLNGISTGSMCIFRVRPCEVCLNMICIWAKEQLFTPEMQKTYVFGSLS